MSVNPRTAAAALSAALAACAPVPPAAAPVVPPRAAPVAAARPADTVIGQNAGQLQALFGTPASRLREGTGHRLQFASGVCVLDAYLYPPAAGREPAVTHVDTRRPTGEDIDRAACVAALRVAPH